MPDAMFDSARKSLQPSKTSDECLQAMKEDLAAWLNLLYGLNIDMEEANLLDYLDTGVLLCRHANAVNVIIMGQGKGSKEYKKLTKSRKADGDDVTADDVALQFRSSAQPETFQARDNIATFLWWCRDGCLQLDDVITFETEDLVRRRNERNVVLCLLEVARRGAKFGMQAPELVRLEAEIDAEIASEEGQGSQRYDKDELVARLMAWRAEMEREKREMREKSPVESSRDSGKCTRESEDDTISSPRNLQERDEQFDALSVDWISEDLDEQGSTDQEIIAVDDSLRNGQSSMTIATQSDSTVTGSVEPTNGSTSKVLKTKQLQFASQRSKSKSVSKSERDKPLDSGSNLGASKTREQKTPVKRHAMIEFDMMTLDEMVRRIASRCTCATQFPIIRISEGKYMVGENLTLIFVRILRHHVMVRIGGGWDTLENYLSRHDPCRCQMHGRGGAAGGFVEPSGAGRRSSTTSIAPPHKPRETSTGGLCVISSTVDSSKLHLASQKAVTHSRLTKQPSLTSSPQKTRGKSALSSGRNSFDDGELDQVACDGDKIEQEEPSRRDLPLLNFEDGATNCPSTECDSNILQDTSKGSSETNSYPTADCIQNGISNVENFGEIEDNSVKHLTNNHIDVSQKNVCQHNGLVITPEFDTSTSLNKEFTSLEINDKNMAGARRSLNFSSNSNPLSSHSYCQRQTKAETLNGAHEYDAIVSEEQEDSRNIFKQIELGLRYLSSDQYDIDSAGSSPVGQFDKKAQVPKQREMVLPHPNIARNNEISVAHVNGKESPTNSSSPVLSYESKLKPRLQRNGSSADNLERTNKTSSFSETKALSQRGSIKQMEDNTILSKRPGSYLGASPSRPASAGVRSGRVQTRPQSAGLRTKPGQALPQAAGLTADPENTSPHSVGFRTEVSPQLMILRTETRQMRPKSAGLKPECVNTSLQGGIRTEARQMRPQSAKVQSQIGGRSQSMRVTVKNQPTQRNALASNTMYKNPMENVNSTVRRRASFQCEEINERPSSRNETDSLRQDGIDSLINERRNSAQSPCQNSRKDIAPGRSRIPQPTSHYQPSKPF